MSLQVSVGTPQAVVPAVGNPNEIGWSIGRFREMIVCWTVPMSFYQDRLSNADTVASLKAAGIVAIGTLILLINPPEAEIADRIAISAGLAAILSLILSAGARILRVDVQPFHTVNLYMSIIAIIGLYYLIYSLDIYTGYQSWGEDIALYLEPDPNLAPIAQCQRAVALSIAAVASYALWVAKSIAWDHTRIGWSDLRSSLALVAAALGISISAVYMTTPEVVANMAGMMDQFAH